MACFVVPVTEAVITTLAAKAIKRKEDSVKKDSVSVKLSTKLGWLNKMLWGGSLLLAFEHVWHGEVVPFFPFLTAIGKDEVASMLSEMKSAGVMMSVVVTAVWFAMVYCSTIAEKRTINSSNLAGERA